MNSGHFADTTNRRNFLLLIQLRWLAIIGQIVTIVFVHRLLGITLPARAMSVVLICLLLLNITDLIRYRSQKIFTSTEIFFALLLDVSALTVQLYLSGGTDNPFISLYLLQVILGTVLLDAWFAWALVAVTSLCFIFLTMRAIPFHLSGSGDVLPFHLRSQGMYIGFVLAACLQVFFVSRIQRNLKQRDAYLAELRQQNAEEAHIVRMGLLASGAAHELGTPLSTLSVILNDWQHMPRLHDDAELADDIIEMQAQVNRCKSIVSDILVSSGDARGEGTLRTTASAFLTDTIEEWREACSPSRLDVRISINPDPAIVSDIALKQVLFNLLDNALEASPGWIGVTARKQDNTLSIVVQDEGPGFTDTILADFGKPYHSTKGKQGSGVGLFLVVNVIRKLGGTVHATNRKGGGASITVQLPLAAMVIENEADGEYRP
ncbi:Sensory transduction protein kinase [Granulibacter bethesdensis]|uniref:ATP-binding protein n=1 Tax=Granulibacter bethesdensis TaxID=364410 RepID=UPI00090C5EC3|nr:ATP-binding protein [Granulibacter bethesdensis]APH56307.1 Sensory transduction protein kinase [Granulibacter bethesdensis]